MVSAAAAESSDAHNLDGPPLLWGQVGASSRGTDDRTVFGRRPNGFYVPRFRNLTEGENRGYFAGLRLPVAAASREDWSREIPGARRRRPAFKEQLSEDGPWVIGHDRGLWRNTAPS